METKSFTTRLPADLYRRLTQSSHRKLNRFIVEAVEEKLQRERQEEIRKGLQSLAGPIDEETRLWLSAQKEAMKHVED